MTPSRRRWHRRLPLRKLGFCSESVLRFAIGPPAAGRLLTQVIRPDVVAVSQPAVVWYE